MSERQDAALRILSVAGWKVLVMTRLRNGAVFDHSYEYLDGPHAGPVWNTLCRRRVKADPYATLGF